LKNFCASTRAWRPGSGDCVYVTQTRNDGRFYIYMNTPTS